MTNTITKITFDGDDYIVWWWDVVWPASSTDWHLAVFDWATGKLLKDGWAIPTGVPSGWTDGQVVGKVSWSVAWTNVYSTITVTLTSAGWSSSTQTVTATGVTASNIVIVSPAPANIDDYATNKIYCSAQGTNSLTFSCTDTPSGNIDVNVVIMN